MKHTTRASIRHLYFVWQVPIEEIAAELRLRSRSVRRALVIRGGARGTRGVARPVSPSTRRQEDPS